MCQQISYLPLYQTLAGGILAILGGLVGTIVTQAIIRRNKRERVKSAFFGEISALFQLSNAEDIFKALKTTWIILGKVERKD